MSHTVSVALVTPKTGPAVRISAVVDTLRSFDIDWQKSQLMVLVPEADGTAALPPGSWAIRTKPQRRIEGGYVLTADEIGDGVVAFSSDLHPGVGA